MENRKTSTLKRCMDCCVELTMGNCLNETLLRKCQMRLNLKGTRVNVVNGGKKIFRGRNGKCIDPEADGKELEDFLKGTFW